jgi:type IX secretion system substrate protein
LGFFIASKLPYNICYYFFHTFTFQLKCMKKILLSLFTLSLSISTQAQISSCNALNFSTGTTTGWRGSWAGSSHTSTAQQYGATETPCANNLIAGFDSSRKNSLAHVHEICTAGTDPHVPISRVAPGHTYSLRLGNDIAWTGTNGSTSNVGYNHQTISYSIPVTTQTDAISYWFAAVFSQEQGNPHAPTEQPYLTVKVFDGSCNLLTCYTYDANETVAANGTVFGYSSLDSSNYDGFGDAETFIYKNWTQVAVPLINYVGQNITIQFETSDCDAGGHFAYAYLTVDCGSFNITPNPTCFTTGTNTLTAPAGYSAYQWSGTGITGSTNTPSTTVNAAGNYSVTLTASGGCSLTIDTTINTAPTTSITVSSSTVCAGSTTTLTASGANTYTWSTGDTTAAIAITPTLNTTYTVTGTNNKGCTNTDTLTQIVINCATTGITTHSTQNISVYPNPAQNNFTIETTDTEKQTVSIFDVNGKLVLSQTISGKTTIDVSNLNAGVYNININGVINKRLVIVK